MPSGFAGLIGRWYRRHTAESMPVQKGVYPALFVPMFGWDQPDLRDSGGVVGMPQSLAQPAIFEGMVGFDNLCKIARAADNLEVIMGESVDGGILELKADENGGAFLLGALCELRDALTPYRTARDLSHR